MKERFIVAVVVVVSVVLVVSAVLISTALAAGGEPSPLPSYDSITYHDGVVRVMGRLIAVPKLNEKPWSFEHRWDGARWVAGSTTGPYHRGLWYQSLLYLNYPRHRCPAIFNYVGPEADRYRAVLDTARLATFGE